MERADIVANACDCVNANDLGAARELIRNEYPLPQTSTPRGTWTSSRLLRVFRRDGFTDRYSGTRLIFPGTLRMLSVLLPEQFPYHRNWKQSETHPAYWELFPTIDHVVPVARGGADDETNIVTTSMLRNGAKSNWLLQELGWSENRAPIVEGWDGLLGWFMLQWNGSPAFQQNQYLCDWHRAAVQMRAA